MFGKRANSISNTNSNRYSSNSGKENAAYSSLELSPRYNEAHNKKQCERITHYLLTNDFNGSENLSPQYKQSERDLVLDRINNGQINEINERALIRQICSPTMLDSKGQYDPSNSDANFNRVASTLSVNERGIINNFVDREIHQEVSADTIREFLFRYSLPRDFKEASANAVAYVSKNFDQETSSLYTNAMNSLKKHIYGKQQEYTDRFDDLYKQAAERKASGAGTTSYFEEENYYSNSDDKIELPSRNNNRLQSYEIQNKEKLFTEIGVTAISRAETRGEKNGASQDSYYYNQEAGVIGVFDGVGGSVNGALASSICSQVLDEYAKNGTLTNSHDSFVNATYKMHNAILKQISDGSTTATFAKISPDKKLLTFISVGDSRIYLIRKGKAIQLSEDEGRGNIIYNSVGYIEKAVQPVQIKDVALKPGDQILLCSDGITGDFGDDIMSTSEVTHHVTGRSPQDATDNLVRMARKYDDRTAIIASI